MVVLIVTIVPMISSLVIGPCSMPSSHIQLKQVYRIIAYGHTHPSRILSTMCVCVCVCGGGGGGGVQYQNFIVQIFGF